jgi:hypothetical protein
MNIGNPIIKVKSMNEGQEWWFPSRDSYDEDRVAELLDLLEMEMVAADATTPRSSDSVIEYSDGAVLYFGWGPYEDDEIRDMFYELHGDGFYITFRRSFPQPGVDSEVSRELWLEDHVEGDDLAKAWLVQPHERVYLDWESYCKARRSRG